MADLPLTLDTLQSPSNEELATQSPLMSPQCLQADTTNNLLTITPERPSNLILDSSQQHHQQHSIVTPSSSATAHGNISPALSSAGSLSPSFLPEMPQWKRDLIQRRKQNVQRTISASSPTAAASVASSSSSTMYGLKTSTSSSSIRSLAGSNNNIDQVASDGLHSSTKDYNKTTTSLSLQSSTTTTKVNKQHATTTTTTMPAITSPIKEKAEKLFGGQYTATSTSSSSSLSSSTATVTTKEEKKIFTNQQDIMEEGLQENNGEEGQWEKSNKTKEYIKEDDQQQQQEEENDETNATTNKQQMMATRLTGSLQTSLLTKREEEMKEREHWFSNTTTQQQHYDNITGAIGNLQNQSLSKCESERLVCTANIQTTTVNNNNSNLNCGGNNSVVKISQKLKENQFIKNEQLNSIQTKKFIKFKTSTYSQDLKSPTKLTATSSSAATTTNCAIKKKMVAAQEMKKSTQNSATHLHPINTTCNSQQQQANRANNRGGGGGGVGVANSPNTAELDNEDLSYGPGIVSKLRYRYLSLALRESMEQQRFNKDQLRRSTSLNNLLDNTEEDEDDDEEENCDEEEEQEENIELSEDNKKDIQNDKENSGLNKKSGILKNSCQQEKRFCHNSSSSVGGSNGVGVTFTETSYTKRSRHLKRGNDSLKRARSVEALLSEKSVWQTRSHNTTLPTCVTIEDKIQNARERLQQGTDHMPPKRLTSIIDDTERPPPDLVKQTLKMFEASANRRPRTTNRSNSKGDVASKVETFKNIIKEQKPVVSYPKPSSPTKKLQQTPNTQKPLKTSTPQASDLLQSPLGRKTLATANSSYNALECLTPLKSNNSLSDHTPDIIPRQKFNMERDFKQTKEKISTNQINKEKFLQSLRETPLSNTEVCESPLNIIKREQKEKIEVDSPLTALTKELGKLKLSDNIPNKKNDNLKTDNYEINNGGGGAGVNSCDGVSTGGAGDALFGLKNEEYKELSSLKNENDKKKQKQINNETIDETNEAAVNYNDSVLTKAAVSTPPSSSDLSDGEEDDEYGGLKTKRITRTALDNIAKAGYTQQFKFNSSSTSSTSNSPSTTTTHSNSGKQIGVIRPLLNTQQQQQKNSIDMETLKHSSSPSSLTTREIEKNRINDLKKSNTSPATSSTSSPITSLDNVIKSTTSSPTTSSSSSSATSTTASAASASSGFSDVDSVISATNSPLWAMRKRRQSPPSVPAENTTMVFNFSNRKEVPDYIENDGVIFRRKRELPKPNESGFVILGGDLSVETSTDFDCDDFSMCPPSPCDVEFVNANIVIDGKSSIRQKSKDATFHVQFNDTLTSTFEYPSEASLIVDDSFSAYNDGYTQPHGSSADDFTHAFQNLVLENCASSIDELSSIHQYPLHHVADEIIQLPTIQANSPANTSTNTNITGVTAPTKNILGNLPLDYPDLEKGIQLTIPNTTTATTTTQIHTQEEQPIIEKKRSRKDLKLPLGNLQQQQQLQKPPLPVKRLEMRPQTENPINLRRLSIKSKDYQQQLQEKIVLNVQKHEKEQDIKNGNISREEINKDSIEDDNTLVQQQQQRKTPTVLNNPQYACFLQQPQKEKLSKYPVQRSRSNEFQKPFGSMPLTTPVLRSNSLRNLEKFHTTTAHSPNSTFTTTTSLYFSSEVNSTDNLFKHHNPEMAKNPFTDNPIECSAQKTLTLHILPQFSGTFIDNSVKSISLNSLPQKSNPLKSFNTYADELSENSLHSQSKSVDNLVLSNVLNQSTEYSSSKSYDNICLPNKPKYSVNMTDSLLNSKSKSVENFKSTENFKSDDDFNSTIQSNDLIEYTIDLTDNSLNYKSKSVENFKPENFVNMTANSLNYKSRSVDNFKTTVDSSEYSGNMTETKSVSVDSKLAEYSLNSKSESNDYLNTTVVLKEYAVKCKSKSVDNTKQEENLSELTENLAENLLISKAKSIDNNNSTMRKSVDDLKEYFANLPENALAAKSKSSDDFNSNNMFNNLTDNSENTTQSLLNIATKSIDTFDNFQDSNENSVNISKSLSEENFDQILLDNEIDSNNFNESVILKEFPSTSKLVNLNKSLQMSIDSLDDYQDALETNSVNSTKVNKNLTDITTKDSTENEEVNNELIPSEEVDRSFQDPQKVNKLSDSEASDILEDIAVGLNKESLFDFTKLINLKKFPIKLPGIIATEHDNDEILANSDKTENEITKILNATHEFNESSLDNSNYLTDSNTIKQENSNTNLPQTTQGISNVSNEILDKPPLIKSVDTSSTKKSKTLRVKTTEKIINFKNMACHNVSTYSTFRKSQNFYKHASKSFKNSIKFYETLNEKRPQSVDKDDSVSISLTDNSLKKAEENRKIFSKSSKLRWSENPDSPTENSYSFEYYDALGDSNGNLVNRALNESSSNLTDNDCQDNKPNLLNEQKLDVNFKLNLSKEPLQNSNNENISTQTTSDSETNFANICNIYDKNLSEELSFKQSTKNLDNAIIVDNGKSGFSKNSSYDSEFKDFSINANMSTESAFESKVNSNLTVLSTENSVDLKINPSLINLSSESTNDSKTNTNFTNVSPKDIVYTEMNSDFANLLTESTAETNINSNFQNLSKIDRNFSNLPLETTDYTKIDTNFTNLSLENTVNSKINNNLTNLTNLSTAVIINPNLSLDNATNCKFNVNFTNFLTENTLNRNLTAAKINKNFTNLSTENTANSKINHNFTNFSTENTDNSQINADFTNLSLKNTENSKIDTKLTNLLTENVDSKIHSNLTKFTTENTVNSYLKHNKTHFSTKNTAETKIRSAENTVNSQINVENTVDAFNDNKQYMSTHNINNLHLSVKPTTDYYFNTSPRPFRRIYETTTVVDSKEFDSLADSQAVLNSPENIYLTSPRPYRRVYEATTEVNWDKKPILSDSDLNSKSANSFTLTNSSAKPFDKSFTSSCYIPEKATSVLNSSKNNQFNLTNFPVSLTNSPINIKTFNIDNPTKFYGNLINSPVNVKPTAVDSTKFFIDCNTSSLYARDSSTTAAGSTSISRNSSFPEDSSTFSVNSSSFPLDSSSLIVNSLQFSASPPTPSPKTFTNTKHLKLKTKLGFEPSTPTLLVKDLSTTSTNKNNTSLYSKSTNLNTMVDVSKPTSTKTCITKSASSSFSSTSCRLSTNFNSTAKIHQENRNITTISSKSSLPPKVLPRRILASTPRTLMATMTSSTCTTSTTAPPKPTKMTATSSSSISSTSSCNKASTTTSNNTPLRRRIPGNTLYYV